uniref:Uncharacterized protein n=1 Tax=Ciona intestinalis TaxID=7719 RepID=H2XK37_CIOIN
METVRVYWLLSMFGCRDDDIKACCYHSMCLGAKFCQISKICVGILKTTPVV